MNPSPTADMLLLAAYFLLTVNLVTFVVYGIDKWKARNEQWRTPESTLLLLALFGGSVGAMLGMLVWHHKTSHLLFRLGVPAMFFLQAALGVGLLIYHTR